MIFSIFTNNNKTGGGHRKRTIRLARYISNLKNIPIKFFENIDFNSLKFNDNVKFCIIDISLIEFQSNIKKIKKIILNNYNIKFIIVDQKPFKLRIKYIHYYYFAPIIPKDYINDNSSFGFDNFLFQKKEIKKNKSDNINILIGKTNFLNKIITDTFNDCQSNKKIIIWGQKSLSPRITSNKYKNISELVSENFFIVKFGQTVYELLYLGKYQCVLNYGLSDIDKNICDYLSRNNLIKFLCPEKLDEYFINYKEEYLNFIKSRKQILLNNKAKLKIDEFIFSP